jgi:hypothetical protein
VTEHASDYRFADSVRVRVRGPERVVRHFDAEYGEAGVAPLEAPHVDVRLGFGLRPVHIPGGLQVSGGHKSARWRVALGAPDSVPLRAHVLLAGGPPSFALSLVQGYVVEAFVALALAAQGRVALPGAGFATPDGVTVVLGRSGAGKTTLAARTLAGGRWVLSDDQVIVDAEPRAWRYPRRLRLYPDIRRTAPEAWARLPGRTRSALTSREWLRRLTRGYVAPSLAVPASAVGSTVVAGPLPLRRLVVVDRSDRDGPLVAVRSPAWGGQQAEALLAEQRSRLGSAVAGEWARAFEAALQAERRTLDTALTTVPVTELVLPRCWDVQRSIEALQDAVGLSPDTPPAPGARPPTPSR